MNGSESHFVMKTKKQEGNEAKNDPFILYNFEKSQKSIECKAKAKSNGDTLVKTT